MSSSCNLIHIIIFSVLLTSLHSLSKCDEGTHDFCCGWHISIFLLLPFLCVFCYLCGRRSYHLYTRKGVLLDLRVCCFRPWNHSLFGFGAPSNTGFTHSMCESCINVCQLCWVAYGQLISVFLEKKKKLGGKILAAHSVFLMLLIFPKRCN